MKLKFISPLICTLLLAACLNTTVITDEDRQLPTEATPIAATETDLPPTLTNGNTEDDEGGDEEAEEAVSDELAEIAEEIKELIGEEDEEDEDEEDDKDDDESEAVANPVIYTADLAQSYISFIGKKGDIISHEGKFTDFSVTLTTNGPDLAQASLAVSVNIESMTTDSKRLTEHLLNDDFFAATTYPTATFTATNVTVTDATRVTVTGNLTMHGVTKAISFPAVITDSYLTATTVLNRNDFGIGKPNGIDAEVPLEVKVVFMK